MKSILVIAFLFATQFVVAQKETKRQTITIKTPNTCNHCKVCETCGGKLEGDLVFVKGIQLVTYNEADQTTTVVTGQRKSHPKKFVRKSLYVVLMLTK